MKILAIAVGIERIGTADQPALSIKLIPRLSPDAQGFLKSGEGDPFMAPNFLIDHAGGAIVTILPSQARGK